MFSKINFRKMSVLCGITIITMIITAFASSVAAVSEPKAFTTSEEAVSAFIKALKENNNEELLTIFGPDANEVISSGDEVADRQRREMFLKAYDEQRKIEPEGDKLVLVVGKNDWPFPIPLVKQAEQWIFDTAAGKEEILNRRIGNNELSTIQVMLAVVDAQREYAMKDRDGDGLLEYAQKFKSDPEKKNGLYW